MTHDMRVFHQNPWHDYTGGSDHAIDEIADCDAEHDRNGEERETHLVIITAEEYLRLTNADEPVVEGFEQVPIDFPVEDVIVGVLKQFRSIDENALRLRWRGMPTDAPLDVRVRSLLGNNGPEYSIIMSTLEGLR